MRIAKSIQEGEQLQNLVFNEPLLSWLPQDLLKYEKLGRGSC